MAKLERTYTVPLRSGFNKAPNYKKTKKAVFVLREFLMKHMKCTNKELRLGKNLNQFVWKRGYKHPPHHVKITVIKDDEGIVKAELFGMKYEEPVKVEEKETKKGKAGEADIKDLEKELEKVVEPAKETRKSVKSTDKVVEAEVSEPKEEKSEAKEAKPKKPRASAKKPAAKKE